MLDFNLFYQQISTTSLAKWLDVIPSKISEWQKINYSNKHFKFWIKSVECLPLLHPHKIDLLHTISVQQNITISKHQYHNIRRLLFNLVPWRKGPYFLYGIKINAEWRSDWKWLRLISYITPLINRKVLDVGCSNGYHIWRMIGAGASLAIGIDPTQICLFQFEAVRKLLGNDRRVHVLPLRIEQLPVFNIFDTVFSMGVLYHCRSPFDHLIQLKNQLTNNGELVLETLVVNGDENTVLVPERYAKMRNVYFIPSILSLKKWLEKIGFINIRIVNISLTSFKEQRRTIWSNKQSLSDFLDPNDPSKTIEGYPAPLRAILIAHKK